MKDGFGTVEIKRRLEKVRWNGEEECYFEKQRVVDSRDNKRRFLPFRTALVVPAVPVEM